MWKLLNHLPENVEHYLKEYHKIEHSVVLNWPCQGNQ